MTVTGQYARTVRVAAVQMHAGNGDREHNLRKATALAEQAAKAGAQLIVLPECAATGYTLDRRMWDWAEPTGGPTEKWLTGLSKRLGVYLGIGLFEAEGDDFYNTYVLASPDGVVAGRVHKRRTEFAVFRPGDSPAFVDTSFGRVGMGICADFHYVDMPGRLNAGPVDIVLMPHAWPDAMRVSKLIKERNVREAHERVSAFVPLYAGMLGVPVVFADQTGPLGGRLGGFLGLLFDPAAFGYMGLSAIADSDGYLRAQIGAEEGVIVADVTLDPSRKRFSAPKSYYGWLQPGNPLLRKAVMPLLIAKVKLSYSISGERKRRARQVSSQSR